MWVGSKLSRMEHASISSFLKLGYKYHLYVYEDVQNVPQGADLLDGNNILPSDQMFLYSGDKSRGGGSISGFSNYFRYELLHKKGGFWVDTDVFCLRELPEEDYIFVEETDGLIASCIMKAPQGSEFANECKRLCSLKDPNYITWGETGPQLVTRVAEDLEMQSWVKASSDYFPIMWTDMERFFQKGNIPTSITVHFWNEMWRRKGLDKNATYDRQTIYERIVSTLSEPKFI